MHSPSNSCNVQATSLDMAMNAVERRFHLAMALAMGLAASALVVQLLPSYTTSSQTTLN